MEKVKELIGSRKFWAALIAVVFLFVGALYPDAPDVSGHALEIAALLGAYVVATGIDPKGSLSGIFKSRKFWATAAGLVAIVAKTYLPTLPFDEGQITGFIVTMSAYVVGVGLADAKK